jgi:hypothetical protein
MKIIIMAHKMIKGGTNIGLMMIGIIISIGIYFFATQNSGGTGKSNNTSNDDGPYAQYEEVDNSEGGDDNVTDDTCCESHQNGECHGKCDNSSYGYKGGPKLKNKMTTAMVRI